MSVNTGNYYTHQGIDRVVTPQADRWFYNFLESGETMDLSLDVDKATGKPTLFINARMEDGGEAISVTGVGIGLDQMAERIREFRFGETGIVYLVSETGQVNIHPDLQQTDQPLSKVISPTAAAELFQDSTYHLTEFERDGRRYVAASLPLSITDWRVVVEVPSAEIYGEASRANQTSLLVGVLVALVFLGIIALVATRMTKPLTKITRALTEIAKGGGDLTQELAVERKDELGQLATGFNQFVGAQREMVRGLLETAIRLKGFVE